MRHIQRQRGAVGRGMHRSCGSGVDRRLCIAVAAGWIVIAGCYWTLFHHFRRLADLAVAGMRIAWVALRAAWLSSAGDSKRSNQTCYHTVNTRPEYLACRQNTRAWPEYFACKPNTRACISV